MSELTNTTIDLESPQAAVAALDVFGRIADRWKLSTAERAVLLGTSEEAYERWQQRRPTLPLDQSTLLRLSYVFRIYASLHQLLTITERADAWPRTPNTAMPFNGRSALEYMLRGSTGELETVAAYLDTACG